MRNHPHKPVTLLSQCHSSCESLKGTEQTGFPTAHPGFILCLGTTRHRNSPLLTHSLSTTRISKTALTEACFCSLQITLDKCVMKKLLPAAGSSSWHTAAAGSLQGPVGELPTPDTTCPSLAASWGGNRIKEKTGKGSSAVSSPVCSG